MSSSTLDYLQMNDLPIPISFNSLQNPPDTTLLTNTITTETKSSLSTLSTVNLNFYTIPVIVVLLGIIILK
jgi:hypothetical protein